MSRRITVTFNDRELAAIQQALETRARMRLGENWKVFSAKDRVLLVKTATWLLSDQIVKHKPSSYDLHVSMRFLTNEEIADEKAREAERAAKAREAEKVAKKPGRPARATKAAPFDLAFLKKNFPERFS